MRKKIKIALIGPSHPFRGGIAAFSDRLGDAFSKEDIDFQIYTFTVQYPSILFPGKTQYTDSPPPKNLFIDKKINSVNPFNWVKTGLILKKQKYDFVIFAFWLPFMGPCYGTISRIIRKNKFTRILSLVHNFIPHEKRIGDKSFIKYFFKKTHGNIAISQIVFNDLKKHFPNKPCIFYPHPIYDHYGEKLNKITAKSELKIKEKKVLLFFGLIRDYKGLDLLIDAFNYLDESYILIIAGEIYGSFEKYQTLINKNKNKQNIKLYTEYIPDDKIAVFFSSADVCVLPYKSATQSGITSISFHFSLPLIATDTGGLKETIIHKKTGLITSEISSLSITDSVTEYFNNDYYDEFSKNIDKMKKQQSWEQLSKKIIEFAKTIG